MISWPLAWLGLLCAAGAYGYWRSPVPGRTRRTIFLGIAFPALTVLAWLVSLQTGNVPLGIMLFVLCFFMIPVPLIIPLGVWLGAMLRLRTR